MKAEIRRLDAKGYGRYHQATVHLLVTSLSFNATHPSEEYYVCSSHLLCIRHTLQKINLTLGGSATV